MFVSFVIRDMYVPIMCIYARFVHSARMNGTRMHAQSAEEVPGPVIATPPTL